MRTQYVQQEEKRKPTCVHDLLFAYSLFKKKEVSITAVGELGRTQEGLKMIFAHPSLLRNYTCIMQTDDSAILTCAFHSFGELFLRCGKNKELKQKRQSETKEVHVQRKGNIKQRRKVGNILIFAQGIKFR